MALPGDVFVVRRAWAHEVVARGHRFLDGHARAVHFPVRSEIVREPFDGALHHLRLLVEAVRTFGHVLSHESPNSLSRAIEPIGVEGDLRLRLSFAHSSQRIPSTLLEQETNADKTPKDPSP